MSASIKGSVKWGRLREGQRLNTAVCALVCVHAYFPGLSPPGRSVTVEQIILTCSVNPTPVAWALLTLDKHAPFWTLPSAGQRVYRCTLFQSDMWTPDSHSDSLFRWKVCSKISKMMSFPFCLFTSPEQERPPPCVSFSGSLWRMLPLHHAYPVRILLVRLHRSLLTLTEEIKCFQVNLSTRPLMWG